MNVNELNASWIVRETEIINKKQAEVTQNPLNSSTRSRCESVAYFYAALEACELWLLSSLSLACSFPSGFPFFDFVFAPTTITIRYAEIRNSWQREYML